MAVLSYDSPARVGFEIVRSNSSASEPRACSSASAKRLGVSGHSVRRENIEEHHSGARWGSHFSQSPKLLPAPRISADLTTGLSLQACESVEQKLFWMVKTFVMTATFAN